MDGPASEPGAAEGVEAVRQRREGLLGQLRALRDPQARFQWAVERARSRGPLPDALRTESNRVSGCQVRLWWIPEERGGRWWFASDSDAVTLKAMTGLLAEAYSGDTRDGIEADPPRFLEELGLLRQLAENRRATVLRVAANLWRPGAAEGAS